MEPRIELGKSPGRRAVDCGPNVFETFQPYNTPVIVIAGERLVSALSGKQHLNVIPCELGHVVQGDGGWLTDRLFHVPNVLWKELRKITSGDRHLVMPTAAGFGRQPRVRPFVVNVGIGKAHSETADFLVRSLCGTAQYSGRVHTAA